MPDTDAAGAAPADWYPDPTGRFDLRYFNGSEWTADVADAGRRLVDPDPSIEPPRSEITGRRRGRLGGVSMAAGIVAVAVGWMPFVVAVGAIAAIVAIACGLVARRRATGGSSDPRAGVGLVTGMIGLVACVPGAILTVTVVDALDRYQHPAAHRAEITDCSVAGGLATAGVSVTSDERVDGSADFVVEVRFVRRGTDNVLRSARVEVDDVPAGESRTATITRRVAASGGSGAPAIECLVGDVNGPYPFGIDIGW